MLFCGTVCVFQSPLFLTHTLVRMCTCTSMHLYAPDLPCLLHCLCTVICKMLMPLCGTECVCSSHFSSKPTPWLECVHAAVCIYMDMISHVCSTVFAQLYAKHGCLCAALCVSQLLFFLSQILVRMCTCVRTFLHVWLTLCICSTPLNS